MGLDRRRFLQGTLAGGLAAMSAPRGVWARSGAQDDGAVRVYLVIVDGLRPDEVELMPQLSALAEAGTFYPQGRAEMVAETTPNHVSMLTGMRADRHGMPANAVPGLPVRVSDDPRYLKADSLLTLMRRQAPRLRSATIGAKDYVADAAAHDRTGDGRTDASYTNDPITSNPATFDSARDEETGTEAVLVSRQLDPDFLFLNLGDVDRYGHFDETGGITAGRLPALRRATLLTADLQLRRLVNELRRRGRWERTVFIVTADHSMDWSRRTAAANLAPYFAADELLAGEVFAAVNGGACLYGLRSPDDPQADERLRRMREIARSVDVVEEALYLRPNPVDGGERHWVGRVHPHWGLGGDFTGELLVTVEPGQRIGHQEHAPAWLSNPIPGNHGHPVTLPIPVVVSGGWHGVRRQVVEHAAETPVHDEDPTQARNIDLAPTTAWLLGLHPPPGGFDGRVLEEAFDDRPRPRVPVRNVASLPTIRRHGGNGGEFATSVAVSQLVFPEGCETVVVVAAHAALHALAAPPLAIRDGAPILPALADGLPPEVFDEVRRLAPRRAVVVGGERVLGDGVVRGLRRAGVRRVQRLAGDDAFATAAAVARELGVPEGNRQVVLAAPGPRGPGLVDAIAAGPVAANRYPADHADDDGVDIIDQASAAGGLPERRRPVLLTQRRELPAATRALLDDLEIDRVLLAGGPDRVHAAVEEELRAEGALVERLGGSRPGETVRRWAERGIREGAYTDEIWLATTRRPTAALAAAAGVGHRGGTLLMVGDEDRALATVLRDFLARRADEFVRIDLVGNERELPPSLADAVVDLVRQRRTRPA